ncbi:spermine oxidase-like [Arapaima gigas]
MQKLTWSVLFLVISAVELKTNPKIVVVGAGMAGIGAATQLRELGFTDVTLLEASEEIGGRINKAQLGKAWIDTGAQYIHGVVETNPVYCLAKKHGLLDDVLKEEGSWSIFTDKGSKISQKFAENLYTAGEKILEKEIDSCDNNTMGHYFAEEAQKLTDNWNGDTENKNLTSSILGKLGKDLLVTIGASDLNNVSLCSWQHFSDEMKGDMDIGGNMFLLPSKLLEDFPKENILLKKPVSRIEWDGSFSAPDARTYPVRVHLLDGGEILADHVVVTISLGCLKAQASSLFSPHLPEDKVHAINHLEFGSITKIFLEYEEPFWESDVSEISLLWEDESHFLMKADPNQWLKSLHLFTVMRPREKFGNVLIGWCAGRVGNHIETMSEEELSAAVTDHLRAFTRNSSLPAPKKVLQTQWQSNPFTRGAYTYIPVGTDPHEMDKLALPLSGSKGTEPDLQVLFAGEGTIKTLYSTVQGALVSGRREAERLAQHHRRTGGPLVVCPFSSDHY